MVIYSGFSHWKWWFSIAMLNYQRVSMMIPFAGFSQKIIYRIQMNSARRIVGISCWRWDHNHFLDFLRLSLNPRWRRIWFVFFNLFVSIAKDITAPVDFSIPSPPVLHLAWKSNGSHGPSNLIYHDIPIKHGDCFTLQTVRRLVLNRAFPGASFRSPRGCRGWGLARRSWSFEMAKDTSRWSAQFFGHPSRSPKTMGDNHGMVCRLDEAFASIELKFIKSKY